MALAVGCGASSGAVDLWVVEPARVLPGLPSLVPNSASSGGISHEIKLAGAANETLSFRFAVRATDVPIADPELRIGALTAAGATIDPSNVRLFRMHPVEVQVFPGWHLRTVLPGCRNSQPLDVLVPIDAPRGGLPRALSPGERYHFWVDVAVPKGTAEGTYTTKIELTTAGDTIGAIGIRLTVWPFILPDEADVHAIAQVDHQNLLRHHASGRGRLAPVGTDDRRGTDLEGREASLIRSTLCLLQEHRLTPVLHKLAPRVQLDGRGLVAIDWERYDALVEPILNGEAFINGLPQGFWPMPLQALVQFADRRDAILSAGSMRLSRQYLGLCARHFDQQGWLMRSYALLSDSTRVNEESVRRTKELAATAGGVDGRIAVASHLWPQDLGPYGWTDYPFEEFAQAVDIWVPRAQFFDPEVMAGQRAVGRRTWVAVDRPPYSGSTAVHAPSAYTRVLAWQVSQLGAEALFLGCVNRWPDPAVRPAPSECAEYDPNVLLYPGGPFGLDEPVVSVRLKHLRRGLQDAAYRRLLSEQGLKHVSATLGRSLAPYAGGEAYRTHFADGRAIGWTDEPAVFDLARDIMAEELMFVLRGGQERAVQFERSAGWRRFMLTTRYLHIRVDGIRLRSRVTEPVTDAECALTIMNRKRVPVSGTVRFADLPEGWTEVGEPRSVFSLRPNASRHLRVTARANTLPVTASGSWTLPIVLTTEDGEILQVGARASCVTAVGVTGDVRIDGDLSDWPLGAANVASDFLLISGGQSGSSGATPARPKSATIGFLMQDGKYLYIAINCDSDDATTGSALRWNRVNYDDLIPVGAELVEVLIDPLNGGTRSPADLYHIAVKPSGTYQVEKGIPFDPPCGAREPWPADIDVATRLSPGRWTVELRIPFASFEPYVGGRVIWGLNITRYDAAHQEFSTWSGASGNAYDPLSLGNLHIPRG